MSNGGICTIHGVPYADCAAGSGPLAHGLLLKDGQRSPAVTKDVADALIHGVYAPSLQAAPMGTEESTALIKRRQFRRIFTLEAEAGAGVDEPIRTDRHDVVPTIRPVAKHRPSERGGYDGPEEDDIVAEIRAELDRFALPEVTAADFSAPPPALTVEMLERLKAEWLDPTPPAPWGSMGAFRMAPPYVPTWWESHVSWPLRHLQIKLGLEDFPWGEIESDGDDGWLLYGGPLYLLWAQDAMDAGLHPLRPGDRFLLDGDRYVCLGVPPEHYAYRVCPTWALPLWWAWSANEAAKRLARRLRLLNPPPNERLAWRHLFRGRIWR